MDFSLDQEQVALRDAVRRFCDDQYPFAQRGEVESTELARQRWQALAGMGLCGLPLPEAAGGSALGTTESMLVAHELGRSLGGQGWVAAVVLAAGVLARQGSTAHQETWLPGVVEGERVLAWAVSAAEMQGDLTHPGVTARRDGDDYVFDGHKAFVLESDRADAWLLLARTAGNDGESAGLTLFLMPADTSGVTARPYRHLDGRGSLQLTLAQARLPLSAIVGEVGQAHAVAEAAFDAAVAAWCAEAVGAMESLWEQTRDYLQTRQQFGRPLASFQALQHRLADALMDLEMSRSMVCAATVAVAEAPLAERRRLVQSAKAYVGRAAREAGHCAIQLHGAMGMTAECRVGHFVKRLMVLEQLGGNPPVHLRALAA